MKRILLLASLILIFISASSCSPRRPEAPIPSSSDDDVETKEATSEEATSQEGPVFTYDNAKNIEQPPEVYLTFSDEPTPLPGQGFVKLKGVISGSDPAALIDVAGRGIMVGRGDRLGNYAVGKVTKDYVILKKESSNVN